VSTLHLLAHAGQQIVPADDLSSWGALAEFSRYGAKHILLGYDHLLFLFGLAVLSRDGRDVVAIAALFALSYSGTLIGGTLLGVDLGGVVVEALIAVSVVCVGLQIAFGRRGHWLSPDPRPVALVFGIAHGLGLSSLLQELRLPGDDLLPAVIGFNLGVEAGQVGALVVFIGLLGLLRAFPFPVRERIPAGFALMSAGAVLFAFATFAPAPGHAHNAGPPVVPVTPPAEVDPIPEEDQDLYHSRVTAIKPQVPGLSAEVLGGDEKLQVTWVGEPPLVVLGFREEPTVRLGAAGVEINDLSPSVYLSGDRYAQVPLPVNVDANASPRWRVIDTPGPFSFYDHRIHWMEAERPPIVGDGAEPLAIFHWKVPMLLGHQVVTIEGALDWVPDPAAIRSERSEVSSPLLSAAILVGAMAVGADVGVLFRRRLEVGEFA
jgi:hydrogenase/urease accessory protein HupE